MPLTIESTTSTLTVALDLEHQLKRREARGREQRQRPGHRGRREGAVDLEALAIAAGQVAHREQDQRRDAERLKQRDVEEEPGGEAR